MKTYRFSLGNTIDGSVGAVIRVTADSREGALERAREVASTCLEHDRVRFVTDTVVFYLNPSSITLDDIEEEE